jgi:DNA-binding MarR family transcriptional regulator
MTRRRIGNILNPTLDAPLVSERMDELIGYHIRRVQIVVMQQFEKLAESQLTPAVFHMLLLIDENPDVSMSTIANQHGVDRASLVPAIQRMESKGWIERRSSPADKRILMLRCTEAGRQQANLMLAKVCGMEAGLLSELSAGEQTLLLSLLKRVARRARLRAVTAESEAGAEAARRRRRAPRRSEAPASGSASAGPRSESDVVENAARTA